MVDKVLKSIREFLSRLKGVAQRVDFRNGPFPLFHTDFYKSNLIINRHHEILSVIDWENAFTVPWEIVEFAKDLSIVPPAMDGALYCEDEAKILRLKEPSEYTESVRIAEKERGLDSNLSVTLEDSAVQHLAHAFWLYEDGRIGFYGDVLDEFEMSRNLR